MLRRGLCLQLPFARDLSRPGRFTLFSASEQSTPLQVFSENFLCATANQGLFSKKVDAFCFNKLKMKGEFLEAVLDFLSNKEETAPNPLEEWPMDIFFIRDAIKDYITILDTYKHDRQRYPEHLRGKIEERLAELADKVNAMLAFFPPPNATNQSTQQ